MCPLVNSHSNKSPTSSRHVIHFLEPSLCVPMCSCGVLWGVKQDGAPADGDDELHPRLPHPALGGHAHALVEASSSHSVIGSPPCPLLLEVKIFFSQSPQFCHNTSFLKRLIPESPSWLLVKGRVDEALAQLARVAACNKQEFKVTTPLSFLVVILSTFL